MSTLCWIYDVIAVYKSLSLFTILIESLGLRFLPYSARYANLFLDNANTGYAEVFFLFLLVGALC